MLFLMRFTDRRFRLPACLVALVLGYFSVTASAAINVAYDQRQNTLSLSAENDPVKEVIEKIARAANCKLKIKVSIDDSITVNFDNAPVSRVLSRVLKNLNHVVLYDGDRIKEIRVYPGKGAVKTSSITTTPVATAEMIDEEEEDFGEDNELGDLVLALNDPESSRADKAKALRALSQRKDLEAIGALVHSLEMVDAPGMRMGIIRALGNSEHEIAVEALNDVLVTGETMPEKMAAVRALEIIHRRNRQPL